MTDVRDVGYAVQSLGSVPPMEYFTNHPGRLLKVLRLMSPPARPFYERFFRGGLVLASMLEDLPYLDNRVPSIRSAKCGRSSARANSVSSARQVRSSAERCSCGS